MVETGHDAMISGRFGFMQGTRWDASVNSDVLKPHASDAERRASLPSPLL